MSRNRPPSQPGGISQTEALLVLALVLVTAVASLPMLREFLELMQAGPRP